MSVGAGNRLPSIPPFLVFLALAAAAIVAALNDARIGGWALGVGDQLLQTIDDIRYPVEEFDDPDAAPRQPLAITHGVATGEVTPYSAVLWARASGPAWMYVDYFPEQASDPDADPRQRVSRAASAVASSPDADYTATVRLEGLEPGTAYSYRVWFEALEEGAGPVQSESRVGTFRTAPSPSASEPVSFVFSGDLGGAGYCRRPDRGYAIFSTIQAVRPHFFVALGDMIYADNACPAAGPDGWRNVPGGFLDVDHPRVDWTNAAQLREIYWRHWRYNRADPHFQGFLQSTSMYVQWDDHEVINDFGGAWTSWRRGTEDRAGYANIVAVGRDAFLHYAPMDHSPHQPNRIYRSFRWGADLDLFLLDTRSYRSRNDLPDTPENGKTMLGAHQLAWLQQGLLESSATWKVIATGVPLSAPTGGLAASAFGRDGWANGNGSDFASRTGFERELLQLIRFLDDHRVHNVVFLAADLHRPLAVRYEADANGDGRPLAFHELVAGPLSAAPRGGPNPGLDPTLNPGLLYGEGGFFNFGYVRLERRGDGLMHFVADVRGEDGQPRPGSLIDLAPYRE